MQNGPLKEFTARGTEIHTPEQALRIAADSVAFDIRAADRGARRRQVR
jgi:methylmalonyl-CoA mutase, N-terminal domain